MLAEPGQASRLLWIGRSPPLGVGVGAGGRSDAEIALPPGARLLLYTDGLVERRKEPIDVSLGRLVEEFDARRETPLATMLDELIGAMHVGAQHRDDVCLLCLQLRARQPI